LSTSITAPQGRSITSEREISKVRVRGSQRPNVEWFRTISSVGGESALRKCALFS
jgi:hypothetical protein